MIFWLNGGLVAWTAFVVVFNYLDYVKRIREIEDGVIGLVEEIETLDAPRDIRKK